jgi:hypothetical protein
VFRRAHKTQESVKGAATVKCAVFWPCLHQVSSEFLSCRNSSHCSYRLFANSKKLSALLELTSKNIGGCIFSSCNIRQYQKHSTFYQPDGLELWSSVGCPEDMSFFLTPGYFAGTRILPYFQTTSQIYSNHFSGYYEFVLQKFGHACLCGHEVCDM